MKPLIIIFIFSAFALFIASCYYDNEEALYPGMNTSCDTTSITFSVTITTMLRDNCYSCHSNSTAAANGNNIRLQDYADVAAQHTAISDAIKHTGVNEPMPKNGGKVSDCAITQFDLWVAHGLPDN